MRQREKEELSDKERERERERGRKGIRDLEAYMRQTSSIKPRGQSCKFIPKQI